MLKPGERARPLLLSLCRNSQGAVGGSGPPSLQLFQSNDESDDDKAKHPLFKLQRYNGSTSLETFLLQFKYLATYLQWKESDRFFHMCASLEGPASYVLWELPEHGAKTGDLECLLQARFGTKLQAESFKATLRSRRRGKDEPLQDLYVDISRLVQLAHPNEGESLTKYVGVESFVNALNDRELEYEILKFKPADLEEAVNHAVRLEALGDRTGGVTKAALALCLLCLTTSQRRTAMLTS